MNRRYPDKRETQIEAEARMVQFLLNVRPHLRQCITVDTLVASYRVPARLAECRLMAAQGRWAREGV